MENPLKKKIKQGEAVIGTFIGIGHLDVVEWLSRLDFDWLLLDAEHAPIEYGTMQGMMQTMDGTGCIPIVRPQWNDTVVIKRVLDMGAYGVLIPWVNSKEDAENAVRACRYPPQGIRGFGPRRPGMFDSKYYETANDEILIAVQIETAESVRNLDEILAVDGIDACYIGPFDLSVSMGFGVPPQWDNPQFLAVFDRVLEAAKKHGKSAGMFANIENIEWALDKGFKFNTVDDDDTFLISGAQAALKKARRT